MKKLVKSKVDKIKEEVERRRELVKTRAKLETYIKSNDILVDQIEKMMHEKEDDESFSVIFARRFALGLREGYQTGFADGVFQYQAQVAEQLAKAGIEFELEAWNG